MLAMRHLYNIETDLLVSYYIFFQYWSQIVRNTCQAFFYRLQIVAIHRARLQSTTFILIYCIGYMAVLWLSSPLEIPAPGFFQNI